MSIMYNIYTLASSLSMNLPAPRGGVSPEGWLLHTQEMCIFSENDLDTVEYQACTPWVTRDLGQLIASPYYNASW